MTTRPLRQTSPSILFRAALTAVLGILLLPAGQLAAQQLEDLELLPGDGTAGQEFGFSVAVDGGTIVVGSRFDDDLGAFSGSAYLFDAASGAQLHKLLADDGGAGDQLGASVALDAGIVAVGACQAGDNGIGSGAAYIFDASTGAQLHKLLPDDGAAGDEFGCAIAVADGVVAVGAKRDDDNGDDSGTVYLFDAATGAQIDKLLAGDGGANDTFGEVVAMDAGILAVGAHGHSHDGLLLFPGAAYLFDVATGAQLARAECASDAQSWDFFGSAISIDNGVVAVGAWSKSIVFDHSGAAYVFDASTGAQIGSRLVPADTRDRQHFGISVAVDGGIVAAGAEGDIDNGFEAGAAYLFDAFSGAELEKLLASDGAVFDRLGASIAAADGVVATGAFGDEAEPGSVYLFGSPAGVACLDLVVENVVGGEQAVVMLSGGTPGAGAMVAWGPREGETTLERGPWCATFDIRGVSRSRIISGLGRVFDASGVMSFSVDVPANLSGRGLRFQGAEGGTCPMQCMSSLVETTVE